ncbi:MAG: hypothetical protein AB9846_13985 [Tenuifilaceae bacterium]
MKRHLIIFLISLTPLFLKSQDKTIKDLLIKGEELLNVSSIPNNGFIIKTGVLSNNSKTVNWKLKYFNSNLDLYWDVPIEKVEKIHSVQNPIVVSPSGNYIYHIESDGRMSVGVKLNLSITQVAKSGVVKKYKITTSKDFGYIQTMFADDNYLYFLTTKNENEAKSKIRIEEELTLHSYKHSDFEKTKKKLELPNIEDPKTTSFWTFAGSTTEKLYLVSKSIDYFNSNSIINKILILKLNGEILRSIKIETKLGDFYVRPSVNHNFYRYANTVRNGDLYYYYSNGGVSSECDIGSFSGIQINEDLNTIVIFGLSGQKLFKRAGSSYSSNYVFKYNFDGNLIWKSQNTFPKQLLEEKYFYIHSTPMGRNISLFQNDDQSIDFRVWFDKEIYNLRFGEEGKFIDLNNSSYKRLLEIEDIKICFSKSDKSKAKMYIDKISPKVKDKIFFRYLKNTNCEILIERNSDTHEIKIMQFNI